MQNRALWVELVTVPPNCRDLKDLPLLATAIDGAAKIIVSGDNDLRSDDALRPALETYDIQLLGAQSFLKALDKASV